MKAKTTIVLVTFFGAILAYYLLVERRSKPPEEAAREAKKIFSFEEKQVRSMRIVQPAGTVRVDRSEGQTWRMTEPVRARADRWACDAAAGALSDLEHQSTLTNDRGAAGLAEMGLDKPRARIEFTLAEAVPGEGDASAVSGDGAPPKGAAAETASLKAPKRPGPETITTVEIGGEVPATHGVFLRIVGKPEIYVVPSTATTSFLKPVPDFRDRSLLDVTILDIGEARIKRPEGDLWFRRKDDDWWIQAPLEDLAEGSEVQGLLSTVIGLRAESFTDEPKTTAAPATDGGSADRGLAPPTTSFRFFTREGREIASLHLGSPVPGEAERQYARVETPEGSETAIVSSSGLTSLSKAASDFRARKPFTLRSWDATGLNLTSAQTTLSFLKKDGVWSASSPASLKVDTGAIEDTLRAISDLQIVAFDAASSPSSVGLEPPKTRIEVRVDQPTERIRTLILGSPGEAPATVYAKVLGRPGIFTVSSTILERISGGAPLYTAKETKPVEPAAPGGEGQHPTDGDAGGTKGP